MATWHVLHLGLESPRPDQAQSHGLEHGRQAILHPILSSRWDSSSWRKSQQDRSPLFVCKVDQFLFRCHYTRE